MRLLFLLHYFHEITFTLILLALAHSFLGLICMTNAHLCSWNPTQDRKMQKNYSFVARQEKLRSCRWS